MRNLEQAYTQCTELARTHYENFPVGWLVPRALQKHVHAIYAFARVADDLADEGYDALAHENNLPLLTPEKRLESLQRYERELTCFLEGEPVSSEWSWIFDPLAATAHMHRIPHQLLYDLLSAFKQDVVKRRYETHDEVLDYCRRSANPIGRLVLHLHGYHDESMHSLADAICTALQLTNFWQDVSVDLRKDRIYIPQEDFRAHQLDEATLFNGKATDAFRQCMRFQVERTRMLFQQGARLPQLLSGRLSLEIKLTWLGGMSILKKIEQQNYDTLKRRPKLGKCDLIFLLPRALLIP